MKSLFVLVLLVLLVLPFGGSAKMSLENAGDRAIFEEGVQVAAKLVSGESGKDTGKILLKFLRWMDSANKSVKELNMQLVFGEPITMKAGGSSKALCEQLLARSADFEDELSRKLLYLVVASALDGSNKEVAQLLSEKKQMSYNLSLKSLLEGAASPTLVDLEQIEKERAEAAAQAKQEDEDFSKEYGKIGAASREEIEEFLDSVTFDNFLYSEATILDAINRLTFRMFWQGIQFTVKGKRLSVVKEDKASNG